jgi:hypothetical protein
MKHQSKFSSQEQQQQVSQQQGQQQTAVEFAAVEELLRYDAKHTQAPPRIAERIQQTVRRGPETPDSWWRRAFKK